MSHHIDTLTHTARQAEREKYEEKEPDDNITTALSIIYMNRFSFISYLQGLPGEKGQKGDLGQPAIDVFQAVKVSWVLIKFRFFLYLFFALISASWESFSRVAHQN